jgi:signal transduction histidine kinase
VEVVCFVVVDSVSESRAKERVSSIGREMTTYMRVNSEIATSELMRSYRGEGVNVYVVASNGMIVLPLNDELYGTTSSEIAEISSRLGNAERGSSVIYTKDSNLNYVVSIDYRGGSYLIVSYSLKVINDSLKMLIVYFVIVGVIILLLSALISYLVSQKLSSGLRTLSQTAVKFSKGDFNVNFANAEYQELADLSDTLNSVRDEVKKSGDFQREILANVTHDLKTPLTMIKAYASMIREISGNNPEKRDQHLQVIIDEADRLTGLVNDVLNVSKLSSNIDEITPKVFNLTEFVYGIINKFSYLSETQGYNFMVDIDSDCYTRADEDKIGQVIYNLLGNAVNYTGADKTVYVSLKKNLAGDRIKLSIKDTGKGISKEELPEIWDRYYRVKETHSRPVKGTGLGLSIVKIILKNHSFDFGVQSELSKGSTFWVDFPCVSSKIDI